MNNIIKLDNNYYIKIINNDNEIHIDTIDIYHLGLIQVIKDKNMILRIDFNKFNIKDYKRILKNLLRIKKVSNIINKEFGIIENGKKIIAYVLNFNETNSKHKDFISGINAIFYKKKYERYNYIYDTVCNYLDVFFYGNNLCDFKNNKCGEKRNTSCTTGCCHHFKYKAFWPFSKLVLCEYLNKENYTCDAKCISCKLFTYDYLKNKGVRFKIKDILLLDIFFNPIQKYFIKYMFFTPKEKILKRLIKL